MSLTDRPIAQRKPFLCQKCWQRFATVLSHPTLGPVCPVCLRPLQRETRKRRRKRKRKQVALGPPPLAEHFTASEPGHPLGPGMPLGVTLRNDGESHIRAWQRMLRCDPCAYCGRAADTVDHIVPKDPLVSNPAVGGKHCWLNMTGACSSCNGSKATRSLLDFLAQRTWNGRRPQVVSRHPTEELAA